MKHSATVETSCFGKPGMLLLRLCNAFLKRACVLDHRPVYLTTIAPHWCLPSTPSVQPIKRLLFREMSLQSSPATAVRQSEMKAPP